jgi:hypothetical protein
MKQIHLIVPFSRLHLKDTLIEAYRPMNIAFHPIMFVDEYTEFREDWIFPVVIPMLSTDCKSMMPGCFKRNYFIKNNVILDGDYYLTADDDDFYEVGVFDAVKQMDDDIVIISLKRGHRTPADVPEIRRYPTTRLIAKPENVEIGKISAQQCFVKGSIFRGHLFNEELHWWDGEIAIHHKQSGEQIRYEPMLFGLFNYYEPGRWDDPPRPTVAFGVLVNDLMRLDMVFRQSEMDKNIQAHMIKLPETACKGLNKLLEIMEAEGDDIAVLAHQDMYFRNGWVEQMLSQVERLPESWTVAGIIGKDWDGEICGRMHDMRIPLHFASEHSFPHPAACFDECCIIVNLKKGFRFDEEMPGFDLYGTQCVLKAIEEGGTAWVIDAFAEHYCMRSFEWYPGKDFEDCFKWLYKRFPNARKIDTTVLGVERQKEAS